MAGRPTKFKSEYVEIAKELCARGAIDLDLARVFNVEEKTINNWKEEFPAFLHAIKEGKAIPDQEVENALLKRAKGFSRTVQRLSKDGDAIDCEEEIVPDPMSCIFWLKNRRTDRWRDKQELEHSGNLSISVNVNKKDK